VLATNDDLTDAGVASSSPDTAAAAAAAGMDPADDDVWLVSVVNTKLNIRISS